MKIDKYPWFSIFLTLLICFLSISCSKKETSSSVGLQISTKGVQSLAVFPSGHTVCYGVDVSASDMESIPQSSCEPKRSLYKGFIKSGDVLKVDVPAGDQRNFDLYAYLVPNNSTTVACPSWNSNLDYGQVYKVGKTNTPVDLNSAEHVVEIEVNFPGIGNDLKSQLGLVDCSETVPTPALGFANVSIFSSNANPNFATTGDTVYLNFDTDLPIADVTAQIFGFSASITSLGGNNYQVLYNITGSETEGLASFILSHASGTALSTDDSSSVTLDRTSPAAPSSVWVNGPAVISNNTSPTFLVSGVENGALVELHADASCSALKGSTVSSGATATVTSAALTPDATSSFYARQIDPAGNISPCYAGVPALYHPYSAQLPFVSTWQTTTASETLTLPLRGGFTYSFIVDWGDGSADVITSDADPDKVHTYSTPNTYTVKMSGTIQTLYFNGTGDKDKIISVIELGDVGWTSFEAMFSGCSNLTTVAGGNTSAVTNMFSMFMNAPLAQPNTTFWITNNVTNMSRMFQGASVANPNTGLWNMSNVTNISYMFYNALAATPDTSTWNTSSVTNMQSVFYNAISANPATAIWDVSNVTTMGNMFQGASVANPDVSSWDVSNVQYMTAMFASSGATPDVSLWNTSSAIDMNSMFAYTNANPVVGGFDTSFVVNMSYMFKGATVANPDVSSWDVSNVTTMTSMFDGASIADPDVSAWDVSNVLDMNFMFAYTSAANPDTSLWNTLAVNTLSGMFDNAISANPNVTSWNVSNVTDMSFMFNGASAANPDVSGWDTTNVNLMNNMFLGSLADPDMSAWNLSNVIDMSFMFDGSLSTTNYDGLLNNLVGQIGGLLSFVILDVGPTQYTSATSGSARAALLGAPNWTITDGGGI